MHKLTVSKRRCSAVRFVPDTLNLESFCGMKLTVYCIFQGLFRNLFTNLKMCQSVFYY